MRNFTLLAAAAALLVATAMVVHRPARQAEPPPLWRLKALSAEEMGLLQRAGGLEPGRAAEINHYPGPGHVLDLADELGLAPEQIQRLSAIEARVQAEAAPLGARMLAQQRALEASFADATAAPARIRELSAAIAETEARLRASHLTAHLDARAVLTDAQLARYEFLQGYSDAAEEVAEPRG